MSTIDPISMLKPRRKITGMSAILLPFTNTGAIDWDAFRAHTRRTLDAGLAPAVNMDTGFGNLIDDSIRIQALDITQQEAAGRDYVAGAFVGGGEGSAFDRDGYARQMDLITARGGIPVIFQSHGLTGQSEEAIVASYAELGRFADRFIGFELGQMFAPFGKIYSLEVYRGLLGIPQCIGAKHSSLSRELEWQRLLLRDEVRPDFKVLTGNDLAIDMVMYGSDYLLGLSTFAPDWFAKRDAAWESGDPCFYQINDVLQYLGFLAFRAPVPAYKHSAAMFLKLRGWIGCDDTHPQSATRPESDRAILAELLKQLEALS
jgi:dihydrodipicolinate synthase/N-acetylneuraminate lyase